MTFSIFQWSCPQYAGTSSPAVPWILVALGLALCVLAVTPGLKIRPALSRGTVGTPVRAFHRAIFGLIGLLVLYEGARVLSLIHI